jgi:hypothetical protein
MAGDLVGPADQPNGCADGAKMLELEASAGHVSLTVAPIAHICRRLFHRAGR